MASAILARRSERRAERLLDDLLTSQGWDERKPPRGNLYLQTEYRDNETLAEALAHASKTGTGYGIPEALLIDTKSGNPLAVIETKADASDIDIAIGEAEGYGTALIASDFLPLSRAEMESGVQERIIGFESEPNTAALCAANMILRGDGSTQIRQADSLTLPDFPTGVATVALMNPPFPHKKTDTPVEAFVERGLEGLSVGGKLAVIVPASLLARGRDKGKWRKRILSSHSLVAVCQLPDELFQPFASVTTSVLLLEKGRAHRPERRTAFVRLQHDGLVLRKSVRVRRENEPNQIPDTIDAIENKLNRPFSASASVSDEAEWSAGAYIASAVSDDDVLRSAVDVQLRRMASFYTRYAAEIIGQRAAIRAGEIDLHHYRAILPDTRLRNASRLPSNEGTIGGDFDIYYGMKELHSREGIGPGRTLIISPTEEYNGTYGWLDFPYALHPGFVTVAQTGSIGEAFVQLEPCAVNDDCLVLLPKGELDMVKLTLATATLHAERWRFNYGRKLTPSRIAHFALPESQPLKNWISGKIESTMEVIAASLAPYQEGEVPESKFNRAVFAEIDRAPVALSDMEAAMRQVLSHPAKDELSERWRMRRRP